MSHPPDPPPATGKDLIAAYRAARLSERAARIGAAASAETLEPPAPAASQSAAREPTLADLGIGPGMRIRLGYLGVHSAADLARADAAVLRAALGEISRLVDVEAWIAGARSGAGGRQEADLGGGAEGDFYNSPRRE